VILCRYYKPRCRIGVGFGFLMQKPQAAEVKCADGVNVGNVLVNAIA